MAKKKKRFDAVAASRKWRRATSRKVRGMNSEERIAFFNRSLEAWPAAPAAKPARELAHR
ncbi:MAG: hypothetical protein ABSA05_15475 [Opitutaceae bacterium]|jgi:hypothetical protein